ncbi:MAG: amidase [Rhodospirillaceae bacterium]|nr:amidase [Rhodospirillaceae bacterium]MBT5778694.1 amidase [Rhodospirillaceae bacterium]
MTENNMPACRSAVEIAAGVRAGETTALAETEAALSRIDAREDVRAWRWRNDDVARDAARAVDLAAEKGPLAGAGVGLKDIIDTAGLPTENGVATDKGRQPETDATAVTRLKAAGAVIIGKTKTTECAFLTPTDTCNPHDSERTPGGSSSGSGAAVGGGMVPLALGSQTVGSVLRPASFCGAWAMKPSWGLIPRSGMLQLSHTLDHIGVYGRSAEDLALIVDVLSGDDGRDPASQAQKPSRLSAGLTGQPVAKPRFVFLRDYAWPEIEPSSAELFQGLAERVGAPTIDMPPLYDNVFNVAQDILAREFSYNLGPRYRRASELISPALREWFVRGFSIGSEEYLSHMDALQKMRMGFPAVIGDFDAAIAPVSAGEAPKGLDSTGNPKFLLLWTSIGVPAISVPAFKGPAGLPIGVQVIGRHGADLETLRAAKWLGRELGAEMV